MSRHKAFMTECSKWGNLETVRAERLENLRRPPTPEIRLGDVVLLT